MQDEVRYFGIEMGSSTVKPGDPSTVFSRRFGDCKDKSLLFVTILRALGIEAYPVLVNSTVRRALADWQPSDGAFDHCIAVARCDDQTYWLDPTPELSARAAGRSLSARLRLRSGDLPEYHGLNPRSS